MFIVKIAAIGLLSMTAITALAQAPPIGTTASYRAGLENDGHDSLPRSDKASNIVPADTKGTNAPTLTSPALSLDASSRDYLRAAHASLAAGHTGEAQQSLEMAETRLLGGSNTPALSKLASDKADAVLIKDALHALGSGNNSRAIQIIDLALNN